MSNTCEICELTDTELDIVEDVGTTDGGTTDGGTSAICRGRGSTTNWAGSSIIRSIPSRRRSYRLVW
jgi:hypothetical protein